MIHFQNKSGKHFQPVYPQLRKIHTTVLHDHGIDPTNIQISLILTSDQELEGLNAAYRKINAPTDVLSFLADEIDPESGIRYLGDIVISLDQVKKQSEELGDSEKNILILLAIHGLLHLLGYDHDTNLEKDKMWKEQSKYLAEFKAKVKIPD
jgi:probable rRNA maturation factor